MSEADGPKPTVCRSVHYTSHGSPDGRYRSECRPAVVTEVGEWVTVPGSAVEQEVGGELRRTIVQIWRSDACHLQVSNPQGLFFNVCEHSEDKTPGTWHWPCVRT